MLNTNDTIIVNNKKFLASELGDEIIMMNFETGDYINLNSVSSDIWKKSQNETTPQKIINLLLNEYEVDEQTCRNETLACIEEMIAKDVLIKV